MQERGGQNPRRISQAIRRWNGFRGEEMKEADKVGTPTRRFRIGGSDEALVILWARGDEPEDIARRFSIDVAVVQAAIDKHGHKHKRKKLRRRRIL